MYAESGKKNGSAIWGSPVTMAFHNSETSLVKCAPDLLGFTEVCGSRPRSGAAVVVVVEVEEVELGTGTNVVATADVAAGPHETVATDKTKRRAVLRTHK